MQATAQERCGSVRCAATEKGSVLTAALQVFSSSANDAVAAYAASVGDAELGHSALRPATARKTSASTPTSRSALTTSAKHFFTIQNPPRNAKVSAGLLYLRRCSRTVVQGWARVAYLVVVFVLLVAVAAVTNQYEGARFCCASFVSQPLSPDRLWRWALWCGLTRALVRQLAAARHAADTCSCLRVRLLGVWRCTQLSGTNSPVTVTSLSATAHTAAPFAALTLPGRWCAGAVHRRAHRCQRRWRK